MKKRVVSAILAVVMVCGLLTGCGGASDKDDVAKSDELRFIDVNPSPERQKYYEGIFEKFEDESGIVVNYESVPWDDAADKLTVLGSSGQLPDIITTHPLWLGQFTESDWILPIDEYVEEHKDEFVDAVVKINWEQEKERFGHVYSVPDGFMAKGIFYRKDWVEEANYEIPTGEDWTYDAYFDLMRAMTDKSQKRYGNSFRGARGAVDVILTYLQSITGGYVYDEEGNFLLDSPECVEALEEFCSIYTEGYVPEDSINWGFVELVDNFTGGLTATLYNDSEVAKACEEKMDPEQWGVLPVPYSSVDGKMYNSAGSPYSYTISKTSSNPDAAIQLVDFLVEAENNMEYCEMGGLIPIKKDAAESEKYGENGPYAVFLEELNDPMFTVPPMFGPFNYTDLHQDMFHTEFQKVLLGQQTAQDMMTHIGDELEARMKQYLADNEGSTVESPKSMQ